MSGLTSAATRQSGIALVLTLILLSVTLIMAVAFFLMSQREQGSVTTQTDAATARYAADSALNAAQAQIVANILAGAQPNPYSYGLLVSTNYINPFGWAPGLNYVNYSYDTNGNALTLDEFRQNLTNLFYLPRPPVFISDSTNPSTPPDFRFYLDLNRNGRYDTNGMIETWATNSSGQLVVGTKSLLLGDPEWVGVLERPDEPYGPNNHFVARYAFIAVPVGTTLDLNAIHNQVFDENNSLNSTVNPAPNGDAYFRNQGVGTYELNLAAFLADLNTNQWGGFAGGIFPNTTYYFYQDPLLGNRGIAFDDARALLSYRYNNDYNTLARGNVLFANTQNYPTNVDVYADGGLQVTINTNYPFPLSDNLGLSFAGADNTNRFFDLPSDLFDLNKTATGLTPAQIAANNDFTARLTNSGTGGATYDRYTFYRLLSQLSTDSEPESGKINLNYSNAVASFITNGPFAGTLTNITIIPGAETNLTPWQPIQFFTIAADSLLRTYTAQWATVYTNDDFGIARAGLNTNFVNTFQVTNSFGIDHIPVWVSNRFVYTPAVNRLLQLAANIYDASQTNFYPHIFRPMFFHTNGNVFIAGYWEQTNFIDRATQMANTNLGPPIEFDDFTNSVAANTVVLTNIYGVPWIIGAKKGFPNFNEFATESAFRLTRKLEGIRDWTVPNQPHISWTNQMYLFNFTNYFGVEFWNSYRSNYLGEGTVNRGLVDIIIDSRLRMALTNDQPGYATYYKGVTNRFAIETNLWHGWDGIVGQQQTPSSFITWMTNVNFFFDTATYVYNPPYGPGFVFNGTNDNYLDNGVTNLPHFELISTNQLQVAIVDYSQGTDKGRIIDYVQLGGLNNARDLNAEIRANDKDGMFDMTYTNGFLLGVYQQIHISMYGTKIDGAVPVGDGVWTKAQIPGGPSGDTSPAAQQAFFRAFFSTDGIYHYPTTNSEPPYQNTQTNVQAPYTPTVLGVQYITWQANDPLVHYLSSDLNALVTQTKPTVGWPENIGIVNDRYMPWGRDWPSYETSVDPNFWNLSYKDPLVRQSDDWDFPTNFLPTVGWLGRVHRGTPWQSIYLKATNIMDWNPNFGGRSGYNTWSHWTGDGNSFDVTNIAPTEDHLLFDLFTTAFNDNATRGRLSVNTPADNLADWSAVFSGMVVLSNNIPDVRVARTNHFQHPLPGQSPPGFESLFINPAGPTLNNSVLSRIVTNIDLTRQAFRNPDGMRGVFEHKGDILAAAQLTDQSPFLNRSANQITSGISDEMYEWLPQQAMSLLSGGNEPARYVIYSWGQTLQPAVGGTYLGSDFFGMVTNYQVTAETATRAVIEIQGAETNNPHAVIKSFNILPPD